MELTKFPWTVDNRNAPDLLIVNDQECIATVWMNSNTESDAKVIAIAPEIYTLMKNMCKYLDKGELGSIEANSLFHYGMKELLSKIENK